MAGIIRAVALGLCLASPAGAETLEFDITIKGLTAGLLLIEGSGESGRYAAGGVLKSTGLLGWVRKIRYDAAVAGRIAGGRYVPQSYSEKADTGKRRSEAVMAYRAGVPQVKAYTPPRDPRPGDIDPATQGGTVDPLTALYAVLRTVPREQACNMRLTLFDGRRRSEVVLGEAAASGDGIVCQGAYLRLEGFAPDEMAEKSRFPFTLTFRAESDGMVRVEEVTMDTLYGKGRMIRR